MTAKLTNPLTRPTALYVQNLLMSSRGDLGLWGKNCAVTTTRPTAALYFNRQVECPPIIIGWYG